MCLLRDAGGTKSGSDVQNGATVLLHVTLVDSLAGRKGPNGVDLCACMWMHVCG